MKKLFRIQYSFGTYMGTLEILAENEEDAINMAKKKVNALSTLAMVNQSYKVLNKN